MQGDERDVIIFSIGYGPDENGNIYRQFGPVSRNGGERRLNVAVTRAKELVEVVSSLSASDIGDVGSAGGRHLRHYLDFAERGPQALQLELGSAGLDTESPFEDSVVDYIRSLGFDVQPQVGVAGFRIDIGVKHPTLPGAFMLGVECDGAMYHSSRAARDRDRLRHQILEGLGWHLHHIWGTAWYRRPDQEKQRLKLLLEEFAVRPVVGRVAKKRTESPRPPRIEFVENDLDESPVWVADYVKAKPDRISNFIDLSDHFNAYRIVDFVSAVVDAEAPLHFDVLTQRVREFSQYDRIGARIRATLERAVALAGGRIEDGFVVGSASKPVRVRRGNAGFARAIEHVPISEMREAIRLTVTDAVAIGEDELITRLSAVFGWRRTGSDIRSAMTGVLKGMLDEGVLVSAAGSVRIPGP